MRLIDADELQKEVEECKALKANVGNVYDVLQLIHDAPQVTAVTKCSNCGYVIARVEKEEN